MPEDSLEQVRLLSNLETSRHKLLQIVLFGQPELDQMLAATSLRQLRDRITHSFRMRPLGEEEVSRYVTFRLRAAGYRGPDLFTRKAIVLLTRASGGLTRRINILADKALLSAFAADTHAVDEKQVQRAVADSELPPIAKAKRPLAYVAAALAIGALLGVIIQWALTNANSFSLPFRQATTTAAGPPTKPPSQQTLEEPEPAAARPEPPKARHVASEQRPAPRASVATPVQTDRAPVSEASPPRGQSASSAPIASGALLARALAPPEPGADSVPARLLPKQIERIEAYSTGGMPLLGERIAAAREVLQKTPDEALTIELYRSLKTDPARVERFLRRAQRLDTLPGLYVIPLTRSRPARVWVVYGAFPTRAEAEAALRRLPQVYHQDFKLTLRPVGELREAL